MSLKHNLLHEDCVKIIEPVGVGSYGQVFRCMIIDKNSETTENDKIVKRNYIDNNVDFIGSIRELDVFSKINHPYVVGVESLSTGKIEGEKQVIKNCKPDKIYFIMNRGAYDCHNMIYSKKASLIVLKEAMAHILLGAAYLNDLGLIHADIKPRNCIWFRDGNRRYMKLADFGLTRPNFKYLPKTTNTMTPVYRAPEMILENKYYDGEKVDSWSIGCTFYEMVCMEPYLKTQHSSNKHLQRKISFLPKNKNEIAAKCFNDESRRLLFDEALGTEKRKMFIDLLSKLLAVNPKDRITPKKALSHPFFREERNLIVAIQQKHVVQPSTNTFHIQANMQRKEFCVFLSSLISSTKEVYDTQYIFHGLRIFDEVVNAMTKSNTLPVSTFEWKILKYVCVYISRKYFDEKDCYSMSELGVSTAFIQKNYHVLQEMELYLLNDFLDYQVYKKSLFEGVFDEYKDANVCKENIRVVFDEHAKFSSGNYNLEEISRKIYGLLPKKLKQTRKSIQNNQFSQSEKYEFNANKAALSNLARPNRTNIFTTRNQTVTSIGNYTGRKK